MQYILIKLQTGKDEIQVQDHPILSVSKQLLGRMTKAVTKLLIGLGGHPTP